MMEEDQLLQFSFQRWQTMFEPLYESNKLTLTLFTNHALLFVLSFTTIKFMNPEIDNDRFLTWLSTFELTNLGEVFLPLLPTSLLMTEAFNPQSELQKEDIFAEIYQQLVFPETRSHLGEYYTPAVLARTMVEQFYTLGNKVIDPACGSGMFVVEVIKQIIGEGGGQSDGQIAQWSRKVMGCDINPIAVLVSNTNVALILGPCLGTNDLPTTVHLSDFLVDDPLRLGTFDLVIGNPPWFVLNKVIDSERQSTLKRLAKEFRIVPKPHQVTHLEISALILYQSQSVLKIGGNIAFVLSNAFLTGDNHAATRQFHNFGDIEVWKFSSDLFRIHSICLRATYVKDNYEIFKPKLVTVRHLHLVDNKLVESQQPVTHVPYLVEPNNNDTWVVRKYVPQDVIQTILPLGESPYHDRVFQGATLVPHNLLYVEVMPNEAEENSLHEVRAQVHYPKKPWDFNPLEQMGLQSTKVETKYLFQILKSQGVVPFLAVEKTTLFLPIEEDEDTGGYKLTEDRASKGWHYYSGLERLYRRYVKQGARVQTLWERINYQNYLVAQRQRAPLKVVTMASGTLVKACVVCDPSLIIDSTNYFLPLDVSTEEEAYFLLGILNSPVMTETIRIIQPEGARGAGRHIHKRPYKVRIPPFDPANPIHLTISQLAQEISQEVQHLVKASQDRGVMKPQSLQNLIYSTFGWNTKNGTLTQGSRYESLDLIVRDLLMKEEEEQ